jgi:hypothetical protein
LARKDYNFNEVQNKSVLLLLLMLMLLLMPKLMM